MKGTGDYISREALLSATDGYDWQAGLKTVLKRIPAADVRPVARGKWKHGVCQTCFFDWSWVAPFAIVPNFCPNCGAKDGGELMELKPCPFCGNKPHMAQNFLGQKYVRCPECGACVWGKDTDDWRVSTMGEKKAEKAAAEAWNRRANDV